MHSYGSEDLRTLPYSLKCRTQGKRVYDSGKHSHLVAFHPVKTLSGTRKSAEYISTTYHYPYLDTRLDHFLYLGGIRIQAGSVDSCAMTGSKRLSGEF